LQPLPRLDDTTYKLLHDICDHEWAKFPGRNQLYPAVLRSDYDAFIKALDVLDITRDGLRNLAVVDFRAMDEVIAEFTEGDGKEAGEGAGQSI